MTGYYLTHPALTNIPVNHGMLENSDWFFTASFYPNLLVSGFPVGVLVSKQPRQVILRSSIRATC